MDTQTWIELAGLALAVATSAAGAWRLRSRRWRLVSAVVAAAERCLACDGGSSEALAESTEAFNELESSAKSAEELDDSRLNAAVDELIETMSFEAQEPAVHSALAAVRRRRWW